MACRTFWTTALVLPILQIAMIAIQPVQAALVGHYKLDETVAGPVVNSVSPPHGTNFGATINQPGQVDRAYDFNGSPQYATIANPGIGALDSFSVAAWINVDSAANADGTWGMGIVRSTPAAVAAVGNFFLAVDNDRSLHFANWRVANVDPTGVSFTADNLIPLDTWTHVAATWDGLVNRLYINGSLVASAGTESTGGGWGAESSIGRNFASPTYHFDGLIDDVGIWNEKITDAQVFTIYNFGLLGLDLTETPVPEPSSGVLLGVGLVLVKRRAQRVAAKALTV